MKREPYTCFKGDDRGELPVSLLSHILLGSSLLGGCMILGSVPLLVGTR
jgi:hypothetical protein